MVLPAEGLDQDLGGGPGGKCQGKGPQSPGIPGALRSGGVPGGEWAGRF